MTPKEKLIYYSALRGPKGTLATLFRFQNKPNSDYPQIYSKHDSLLNHESRLLRETSLWLADLLGADDVLEIQHILVGHDVRELIDGDVSRLAVVETEETAHTDQLLLPDDVARYENFVEAQNFLENGREGFPKSVHAIIARIIDTIDGNYFAFAMLANYAEKIGSEAEELDPNLQKLLDRSYGYVNKMRVKYRVKIAQAAEVYHTNLNLVLKRLQQIEADKINRFSQTIWAQGYQVTELV